MPMRQPPLESGPSPGVTTPGQLGPINRVFPPSHGLFDLHHVIDRNSFGNADDQIQAGVGCFENGISGERRRDENGGDRRAGLPRRFRDRVKYRDFFPGVLEGLAALARRDAGDDLRAVIN